MSRLSIRSKLISSTTYGSKDEGPRNNATKVQRHNRCEGHLLALRLSFFVVDAENQLKRVARIGIDIDFGVPTSPNTQSYFKHISLSIPVLSCGGGQYPRPLLGSTSVRLVTSRGTQTGVLKSVTSASLDSIPKPRNRAALVPLYFM